MHSVLLCGEYCVSFLRKEESGKAKNKQHQITERNECAGKMRIHIFREGGLVFSLLSRNGEAGD